MLELLTDIIGRARKAGADAADAVLVESTAVSHERRNREIEKLERQESHDLGLRVFFGSRQAVAATSDFRAPAIAELVERAVAMARAVPQDRYCGLADPTEIARAHPELDLDDPAEPDSATLTARAAEAEDAALAVKGVTNSEGSSASWSRTAVAMAASNGFTGTYSRSRHAIAVSVLAGEGLGMDSDYDFTSATFGADLLAPGWIGRSAGERAVKRLGARKPPTQKVPVVYEWRVASGLVRHLASAINGSAVSRGTSFLKDRMGTAIAGEDIEIVDDPLRRRGLGSRPFDGEGLAGVRRAIVEQGRLTSWILDLRSARQLGLKSTGHASRGTSSPPSPSPSNLYLAAGKATPAELIADIKSGFFVTSLSGMGVNPVTGDYSRGASGFWIENGEILYPVNEVTIAGNLTDMFKNMRPANDLVFRSGVDAPTVRIDGLTVAGR
jgi:PmbA protein